MELDKTTSADEPAPDWTGAPQEQIARTELGIARVRVETVDTPVGSAGSTSRPASRQNCVAGGAVQTACREVAAELLARASVAAGVHGDRAARLHMPGLLVLPWPERAAVGCFGATIWRRKVTVMPKYLWQVSYTPEGARGLAAEGGTGRRAAVEEMLNSVGGRLEAFYYAFGSEDLIVIADVPDNVSVAALSLRTAIGGAARSRTTVLLTPEEIDEASRRTVEYRLPGG